LVSAKDGRGVREVLEGVVRIIPPPAGSADQPLKALIFDSWFDNYQGAVVLIRIMDGEIVPNMMIRLMSSGREFEVLEVGVFSPKRTKIGRLGPGEVGYICAGMKELSDTKIGDTITDSRRPTGTALPG
jgi:GTP-binding protein LepA